MNALDIVAQSCCKAVPAQADAQYMSQAKSVDCTFGPSMEFDTWRYTIRVSNTEPLVRLNLESRDDDARMKAKIADPLSLIDA